jgi:(p)ppGpp synthase/HD superfamily hydrolase
VDALLEKISSAKSLQQATHLLGKFTEIDETIQRAIDFAAKAHEGQFRKSGEPYIVHPVLVASIVSALGGDESMVISAVLHDVVEDTPVTIEEVQELFGSDVAALVDGLTKIDRIREENLLPSTITWKKQKEGSRDDKRKLVRES